MPCTPRPWSALRSGAAAAGLLVASAAVSCRSLEEHALRADEQAYALIAARRAQLEADPDAFTIQAPENRLRERLLEGETIEEPLSLVDVLAIAAENSRDFQDRREALYLAALDVTLEQWRFGYQPSAGAGALAEGVGGEGTSQEVGADLGLSRLLGTGASIVGGIGLSAFNLLSSDAGFVDEGLLSLRISQPLLRGFGAKIVMEPLTQAQRSLVYEVRTYERFRRTFAVDVANRYFRILQQRITLENERRNVESLRLLRERNMAFAEAGQLSEIQADQARQDELDGEARVVNAQQQLESLYDDFRFFLGLPIEADFRLDPSEFDAISEDGLENVVASESAIVGFALENRLDYLTSVDRITDAERRLRIAGNQLDPDLGISAGASVASTDPTAGSFDVDDVGWDISVNLGLPVNRLPERNAYRAAQITLNATRRAQEAFADGIVADLRDALRDLRTLRESYRIQTVSVELADRRVESSDLSFEAGRAATRDVLEARRALLQAQNSLARALVDYRLATLALWRDLECLRLDDTGIYAAPLPFELSAPAPPAEGQP